MGAECGVVFREYWFDERTLERSFRRIPRAA